MSTDAELLAALGDFPEQAALRLSVLSAEPLIILGSLDYSGEGRNLTHPQVRAVLGDKPATLLATLPWSHENPHHVEGVARLLRAQAALFPHQTTHVLCNTPREAALFAREGIPGGLFNHNIFIDHARYQVQSDVPRRFDALYVAVMDSYKRHALMSDVDNGALAYWRWATDAQSDAYYAQVRRALPKCHFANQPDPEGPYELIDAAGMVRLYNQSRVGLCLSASEGAMRASIEYLLCGLPVVTTPSEGGRDAFFDPAYVITVEPDAAAVAAAVRELIARNLDPYAIRAATIAKVRAHRQNFVALLRGIYQRAEAPWPPAGYFRDPFRHPYEDWCVLSGLPEKLKEAQTRHDAALTLDPDSIKTA